jgi:hypothetical protein
MEGQIGIKHSALIRNAVKEIWSHPVQIIHAINSFPCECGPMSSLKNIFFVKYGRRIDK